MAILDIRINNRSYQIACDDGQEAHVRGLSREVDTRVQSLAARMGGQVADGTLLVLAALMMSDELAGLREQNKNLKLQIGNSSQSFEVAKQTEMEMALAKELSDIADGIDALAQSLSDKNVAKS